MLSALYKARCTYLKEPPPEVDPNGPILTLTVTLTITITITLTLTLTQIGGGPEWTDRA